MNGDQRNRSPRTVLVRPLRSREAQGYSLRAGRHVPALLFQGAQPQPEELFYFSGLPPQRAFALHQLRKMDDAAEALNGAPEWLLRTGILHYNLACYEAQLGDLSTAKQCMFRAIELNAAFKKNAQKDPDLADLWN